MHDIICPNCGDRFLASDVAFDLSGFVTPLLHEKPEEEEGVLAVKFRFFADEDGILRSPEPGNDTPLAWDTLGGPNIHDPLYSYVVTAGSLFQYVCEKVGRAPTEIEKHFADILVANAKNNTDRFTCNSTQISVLRDLYYILFGVSESSAGAFDLGDDNVNVAIKILLHIYKNRLNEDNKIVLRMRCYSAEKNGYHVPDILFVQDGFGFSRIKKCCRFCGIELPTEFGYYKMMPVVLLGSHFAGKTSFLLSLYHTVKNFEPFISEGNLKTYSLNNDINLEAFEKNLARFAQGQPPVKTDFFDIPILNLRVNDVIYSFVDWPGEKFISDTNRFDSDFIYGSRQVITRARHILFFMEPSQIDPSLESGEEHVKFDADKIIDKLQYHLNFPERDRFRGLLFVVNKADMLTQNPNTAPIFEQFQAKGEIEFYNNGNFVEDEFKNIERTIKEGYIAIQNPALLRGLENIEVTPTAKKMFIPVAPYGATDNIVNGMVVHRACLSGLPFLKILQIDSALRKKSGSPSAN